MKFTPAIADKSKIMAKTKIAIDHDLSSHDGIPVGYGVIFFDPFKTDVYERFSFCTRFASFGRMSDEEKKRLEDAIEYLAYGMAKIFAASCGELSEQGEAEDMGNYMAKTKFKH